MVAVLFSNLLLAHLIADFWLQSDRMVAEKKQFGFRGRALYFHSLIVAVVSYVFVFDCRFWCAAILIFMTHCAIDYVKTCFKKGALLFAVDQLVHVVLLYIISKCYISCNADWHQIAWIPEEYALATPALICAFVVCTSPANYFIREIIADFKIDTGLKKKCTQNGGPVSKLKNAGALIGSLERLLVLLFVLIGNYEAAGFTVAAKSILRFKDDEGPRTEFVLVGTLLSFLIAVVVAMIVLAAVFDFRHLKG